MSESVENKRPSANRKVMVRTGLAALFLLAGTMGLYAAQAYWNVVLDKPPAPLRKPLNELADSFGHFFRKLNPDGTPTADSTLPPNIVEGLGTTDYLLRDYLYNERPAEGRDLWVLSLNLNYYPSGDATPHVPENCWVANGRKLMNTQFITVTDVPRNGGGKMDLEMKLLTFSPMEQEIQQAKRERGVGASMDNLTRHVGYIFHVNGQYESNPEAVKDHFWNAKNKFAYHAKIEVTLEQLSTDEEAIKVISDFMRDSLPSIEECLPDPRILTEGLAASTPQTQPASQSAMQRDLKQ